jgi:putative ABC transport system permease protein
LPGTEVIENAPKTLTRALAGAQGPKTRDAAATLERETDTRLTDSRGRFSRILSVPVVVFSVLWVGLLAFGNVRARREEIGVLRAMGFRSRQIACLFLSRSVVMGMAGGIMGFLVGVFFAVGFADTDAANASIRLPLFEPALLGAVFLIAVGITTTASLIPSLVAARQDPAALLRQP